MKRGRIPYLGLDGKEHRRYWTWLSRRRGRARPPIDAELRALIRRDGNRESDLGLTAHPRRAPHARLDISERTVSRYVPRRPSRPDAIQRWFVFLRNHRDATAAMDLFTVPTITFRVLYVWFVVEHGRR
jgi:hypothetical protein